MLILPRILVHASQRLAHWRGDDILNRVVRGAAVLLSGGLLANGLSLACFALVARGLGPRTFGVFTLIQAYVSTVDQLVNWQSWQAVTKYGAEVLQRNANRDFASLVKFGLILDLSTGVVGSVLAISGGYLYCRYYHADTVIAEMIGVFSVLVLSRATGTPSAVLRLFRRFDMLALQQSALALLRLIAVLVVFSESSSIWAYVVAWVSGGVFGSILLLCFMWRELRRQGHGHFVSAPVRGITRTFEGLWRFLWTTNLSTSLRVGAKDIDLFVVGSFLGAGSAAVYRVARELGRAPAVLLGPMQETLYPELARLWAAKSARSFVRTGLRVCALGALGGVVLLIAAILGAPHLLKSSVGADYAGAYKPMVVYMMSTIIFLGGLPFLPVMLSIGRPHFVLWIYLVSSVVYYAALLPLTRVVGVIGSASAQIIFMAVWFVLMVVGFVKPVAAGLRAERDRALADGGAIQAEEAEGLGLEWLSRIGRGGRVEC